MDREAATEAWRVKVHLHPKYWTMGKHARGDENIEKEEEEQEEELQKPPQKEPKEQVKKSKRDRQILCFHNRKKKFIPLSKARDPSLGSLARSCNTNCCRCCALIARYLKDVVRCVYCIVNLTIPNVCFCQTLKELLLVSFQLCCDCFNLVSTCLRCVVGVKH